MPIQYGVVKGKVVAFGRHENVPGTNPHFHVVVEGGGKRWRCPVNVKSKDPVNSEVWFRIQSPLTNHPLLPGLKALPDGLKKLPDHRPGLTLDYVRDPLLNRFEMRRLPFRGNGPEDDIQDVLEGYVRQAQTAAADVYVFGEYWENRRFPADEVFGTDSGVHDVHMNQGNSSGFAGADGIYQDGALLIDLGSMGWLGIFLAFNSQVWATDEQGRRKPGFAEGPHAQLDGGGGGGGGGGQVTRKRAAIVAALVNPTGHDVGKETVTIFNASNGEVNLNGWRIVDRQNRAEVLGARFLPSNEAVTIQLTGNGAQLGNDGGTIRLFDAADNQLDTKTYTKAQASPQGDILVL